MEEEWKRIPGFPDYKVSNLGRIRAEKSGRILVQSETQFGLVRVGMMQDGVQRHRSLPKIVARAFVSRSTEVFDTPINMDGDRWNNAAENLTWRPRWFAIKYHQQFKHSPYHYINQPLRDRKTGEVSENSFECAKRYGLLESDLCVSIWNYTPTWPTYQTFDILED